MSATCQPHVAHRQSVGYQSSPGKLFRYFKVQMRYINTKLLLGYHGIDIQFPNTTARDELPQFPNVTVDNEVQQFSNMAHNQVQQFSNTTMDNEAQQLSDGVVDDDVQDNDPTTDLDSVSADGGTSEPLAVEPNVKLTATSTMNSSNRKKSGRNMFYGVKMTARVLYAQQNNEINRCVEARIKDNPELRVSRVHVLAEERGKAWDKLPQGERDKWSAEADKRNDRRPELGSVR
jgi:hypothetical protein